MKYIKYFIEFLFIISLFAIFKIIGLKNASTLGEKETKRLNQIYQKVVKSRMREIIKFRPDLSTPGVMNN